MLLSYLNLFLGFIIGFSGSDVAFIQYKGVRCYPDRWGKLCYHLSDGFLPFEWASAKCRTKYGGQLAVVPDPVTHRFISDIMYEEYREYAIMGAFREGRDFFWGDPANKGDRIKESFWAEGEPGSEGDCIRMEKERGADYRWHVWPCQEESKYICQIALPEGIVSVPTTATTSTSSPTPSSPSTVTMRTTASSTTSTSSSTRTTSSYMNLTTKAATLSTSISSTSSHTSLHPDSTTLISSSVPDLISTTTVETAGSVGSSYKPPLWAIAIVFGIIGIAMIVVALFAIIHLRRKRGRGEKRPDNPKLLCISVLFDETKVLQREPPDEEMRAPSEGQKRKENMDWAY